MKPLTAAELVQHPERVADLEPGQVHVVLAQLAAVTAAVASRLPTLPSPASTPSTEAPEERLLKIDEAAAMLGMSPDFLRRSDSVKSLRVRIGQELRFSLRAIHRFIAAHRG